MAKINFRKSIKLGNSGVRVNLSRKGVGVSTGVKGLRAGIGPTGGRVRASLPGTGLYMEKRLGTSKQRSGTTKQTTSITDDTITPETLYNTYQEQIEHIQSFHKKSPQQVDWLKNVNHPPFNKGEKGTNERKQEQIIYSYKPNFITKLFRLENVKRKQLEQDLQKAIDADQKAYSEWEELTQLADGIQQHQPEVYVEALKRYSDLLDNSELARQIEVTPSSDRQLATISIYALPDSEFPQHELSMTKTGKISEKAMTKTKLYALYQNHVCSVSLHAIRVAFALLPLSEVLVHVYKKELDAAVGHEKEKVILSLKVNRAEVEGINFDLISPPETIASFNNHQMKFRKTKGFAEVEVVE
jgi:hypothetical protein